MLKNFPRHVFRLILGATLIVVSVIGVTTLVSGLDRSRTLVVAANDLPAGHVVVAADVTVAEGWLSGTDVVLPEEPDGVIGKVTTRPLRHGELMSAAVVADRDNLNLTTLVVSLSQSPPSKLRAGDTIELWSSGSSTPEWSMVEGAEAVPAVTPHVVTAGEFVRNAAEDQSMEPSGTRQVEIVVAKRDVPVVLAVQAAKESLVLLPAVNRS